MGNMLVGKHENENLREMWRWGIHALFSVTLI
jgi:hypothetical protein